MFVDGRIKRALNHRYPKSILYNREACRLYINFTPRSRLSRKKDIVS